MIFCFCLMHAKHNAFINSSKINIEKIDDFIIVNTQYVLGDHNI